jgi:hypothetical protein
MWFEGTPPTMEAGVIGLKEAIMWLGEMDLSRMSIELDCEPVVNDIIDKSDNRIEYGSILKVCRSLLDFYSNFIKISFTRRQANSFPHCLARTSKLYVSHHIFDSIPFCIFPIVMSEMFIIFGKEEAKRKRKDETKAKNYLRGKKVLMTSFLRRSWTPDGGETLVKKSAYE